MDVVDVDNYSGADGLGGLDPNTQGINTSLDTIVFELGDDGLPVLMEIDQFLTNQISNNFVTDLINRFRSRNYFTSYLRVYQASNTFTEGNFLTITSTGSYVLSTSSTNSVYNTIGVVTSIGIPDTDWFTYRPFGQYLRGSRILPSLTGPSSGVGKIYYLDTVGGLTTTTPTSNPYPVYLQVSTGGDAILLKGQYGLQPSSSTGGSANFDPMFTVDFNTGLITIASSTGGNPQFVFDTNTSQLQLGSGASIGTISQTDTVFIDANLNVYNSLTVDATTGITSFTAYTGGNLIPAVEIDPYSKQVVMMSGSSITSYNPEDTVYIDANLNVFNSFTVDANSGITSFVCYTGGELVPAVEIDPCDKQLIMMSGSSITSVNPEDTVYIDANLNVFNTFTVDANSGIISFVCYSGSQLIPAVEIDPCNNQLIMMSGSSITSVNPEDTVYIDSNLNVYNSMTVDAITGITSFVCYTGGELVPAIEIDPCSNQLIMMSGSSITSVNPEDTVYIDSNLNVYNSMTVDAITGITSFVCYTGGDLVPAVEIDPCGKQLVMMSGSSITSVNPEDTIYIDSNLNVYNSMTVDAVSGITSFVCYTGGDLVPSFEIDPCNKELIMMTGSTIRSENPQDTVFIDGNFNSSNILTVDQVVGNIGINYYTGGNLIKNTSIDVYGNIISTGTANISSIGTNNLIINNFSNNGVLSSPITINANRGRFGFNAWSSTGATTILINNNRVNSSSSIFVNISNYYTSTTFPTILACVPLTGSFSILVSNNVGLSGIRFDIDFFVVN
jgi:hypothetical protein